MTEHEQTALVIKGLVASMPAEHAQKVNDCVAEMKAVLDKYGELGTLALGLLGSEMAAKELP